MSSRTVLSTSCNYHVALAAGIFNPVLRFDRPGRAVWASCRATSARAPFHSKKQNASSDWRSVLIGQPAMPIATS